VLPTLPRPVAYIETTQAFRRSNHPDSSLQALSPSDRFELTNRVGSLVGKIPVAMHFIGNRQTIVSPDTLQHPVNVVFYRLRGEIQMRGDFFVRPSPRDEWYEFLLPASQSVANAYSKGGPILPFICHALK